jgi:hypothetical protein
MHSNGLKSSLRNLFPFLFVASRGLKLLYSDRSFLNQSGYTNSIKLKRPCRKDGTYLPWMNYQVITFLEQRLTNDLSLFEYGSGYSTLFFSSLVNDVTAIEHHKGWYDVVKTMKPESVNLLYQTIEDESAYCNAANRDNKRYDIIVGDGRERVQCANIAKECLTERGVIILDDSSRPRYIEAINNLTETGFKKLDFIGLKPGSINAHQTTIFYRNDNCLGI